MIKDQIYSRYEPRKGEFRVNVEPSYFTPTNRFIETI